MIRTTKIIILLLALFCAIYITVNFLWLKADTNSLSWDPATHAHIITVFNKYINSHSLLSLLLNREILLTDVRYPPLLHLSVIPLLNFFPVKDVDAMVVAMNIIFLPILVFSVFGIGKIMFDEKAGFLAAYLTAMYPFSIAASRYLILEFPLMAMVALLIYLFLRSDDFRRPAFSLFFGVIMGLGMLLKQTFIFFAISVIAYFFTRLYLSRKTRTDNPKRISNLCAALFICLLVCGWWYFYAFTQSFKVDKSVPFYFKFLNPLWRFLPVDLKIWKGIIQFYPIVLLSQISIPFALMFLISLPSYIKGRLKYKYLPVFFIISALFMHTFFFTKDLRYIIPIFTGFALITALGFFSILNIRLCRVGIWIIITFSLLNFYGAASGKEFTRLFRPQTAEMLWIYSPYYSPYIRQEDWKMGEVVEFLKKISAKAHVKDKNPVVLTGLNHIVYNSQTVRYYSAAESLNLEVIALPYLDDPVGMLKSRQYDMLLYKDRKNLGIAPLKLVAIDAFLKSRPEYLSIVYQVNLPDNSSIIIYRCQREK
ncbi:MAG: glycosyltransferase family 39 protein [Candidatus Omnitrophota bacterium]|jgi:4-amino-4-deoxy-L-arabinose transferase-like glycosyltransferase